MVWPRRDRGIDCMAHGRPKSARSCAAHFRKSHQNLHFPIFGFRNGSKMGSHGAPWAWGPMGPMSAHSCAAQFRKSHQQKYVLWNNIHFSNFNVFPTNTLPFFKYGVGACLHISKKSPKKTCFLKNTFIWGLLYVFLLQIYVFVVYKYVGFPCTFRFFFYPLSTLRESACELKSS